ncbi:hypothetical protein ACHQM5_004124 [Ranunculus cassubicifolius]
MATSTTVNVIEQCKISPSGTVPPSSLPLTTLDVPWLPLPTVQRLLFYEFHHPKTYFLETIIPNIKHSLSVTLQHFFPLAGNLAWPLSSSIPEIQYVDGDFLLLTVAESDHVDFTNLVGNQPKVANDLYRLAPKLPDRSTDKLLSLMALQVTLFPNQGICIGITYSHVVADGRAIHHFIKSWASICRQHGKDGEFLLPFHDRSMLIKKSVDTVRVNCLKKYNITRDTFYLSKNHSDFDSVALPTNEKILATFIMRPDSIKRLRQSVQSRIVNEKLHLSTFVLTCAYVWVCLIKAQCGEEAAEEDTKEEFEYLIFSVDSRSRLDPPLPSTFFGNCLTGIFLKTKASDLTGKDGIIIAAALIGNAIQNMENGDAIIRDVERLLSSDILFSSNRIFSVAGSPKFGIYETDFGWGNPKKSEIISIAGTGAISLTECPTELGGVEVGLVRKVSEMNAFASLFAKTIEDFPC